MHLTESHIITTPTGKYTVVGLVPVTCLTLREPTPQDIMAGRIYKDDNGKVWGWTGKCYDTEEDARVDIAKGQ